MKEKIKGIHEFSTLLKVCLRIYIWGSRSMYTLHTKGQYSKGNIIVSGFISITCGESLLKD